MGEVKTSRGIEEHIGRAGRLIIVLIGEIDREGQDGDEYGFAVIRAIRENRLSGHRIGLDAHRRAPGHTTLISRNRRDG